MTSQKKATVVSSSVAALLTLIKLAIGIASGSVAVLASAIDSVLDMFVSIFNYFAISNSEKPADKIFNYGRGKIEALASVIEGTIITISGLFLLYQAVQKAINNQASQFLEISIYVMIISLIITILLVIYLSYIAKKTNSMVIKADALHYKTDVFSNLAVLISLLLVTFTGYEIIDVIVGGGIALYIIYSAYELIHDGILVLLDRAVDEGLVLKIEEIIKQNDKVNTYHLLKTREAANQTFVEVHLVFNCLITLMEAHKASDFIENSIKKLDEKRDWIINIHMDPYDDFKLNDTNH
ncbi:cation diffusion facilitator family transporter [Arcobacter suis]|uniref:Divalent metal cation transporter (ZT_dimer domain) n=1 Tax=Arcobacter suis CECT 7833 TaxID=663365 RepID=A0AAD0SSE7_9BACT|nr:cation diffusion facilitator family transporter [Arcobacter suis]AXX90140.1 divalent metal cation transporter (ZT_dimer domain) [Arcobacter suis CECT 7833]